MDASSDQQHSLAFNAADDGFPSDDLRKILHGQSMAKVQNGEEILPKFLTP